MKPPKTFFLAIVPLLPVKEAFLSIQREFRENYSAWMQNDLKKMNEVSIVKNERAPTKENLKLSFRFDVESDLKIRELEVRFLDWGKSFKTYPSLDQGVNWIDLNIRKVPFGFQTLQLRMKVEAPEAFSPFQGAKQNLEAVETKILVINNDRKDQVYRIQASVAGWLAESLDFRVLQVR